MDDTAVAVNGHSGSAINGSGPVIDHADAPALPDGHGTDVNHSDAPAIESVPPLEPEPHA